MTRRIPDIVITFGAHMKLGRMLIVFLLSANMASSGGESTGQGAPPTFVLSRSVWKCFPDLFRSGEYEGSFSPNVATATRLRLVPTSDPNLLGGSVFQASCDGFYKIIYDDRFTEEKIESEDERRAAAYLIGFTSLIPIANKLAEFEYANRRYFESLLHLTAMVPVVISTYEYCEKQQSDTGSNYTEQCRAADLRSVVEDFRTAISDANTIFQSQGDYGRDVREYTDAEVETFVQKLDDILNRNSSK